MVEPLAIYGAFIGTIAAIGTAWNMYDRRFRDRARLRLNLATGFVQDRPDIKSNEWLWFLEVQNFGRRPLTISSLPGLAFPNERFSVFTGTFEQVPKRLDEGSKITFWLYERALRKVLKEQGMLPNRILLKDDAGDSHTRRIARKYLRQLKKLMDSASQETGSAEVEVRLR